MSGYGVPGSDYSKAMEQQSSKSYGQTELRDIGGGYQQYYALNMASGEWEPIGKPMPKPNVPQYNPDQYITVTTPNGTDVTFGPNETVTKTKHVDTSTAAAQQEAYVKAFEINTVIGNENVPAGNGRAYGGQNPVYGNVWVIGPNTPVIYEPGNTGYQEAWTPTGKSLKNMGGYDPLHGVFVVGAKTNNQNASTVHELFNVNETDFINGTPGFTGGHTVNELQDRVVTVQKTDNSIIDLILGKKAQAQDASIRTDFTYGNNNISEQPNLSDLNVQKVTNNPMVSVGVGELKAGNPVDVGRDPLAIMNISVLPKSSVARQIMAPATFEKSSQMKYNEKIIEVGPKDEYWHTQEGKSLEQSANLELAFSVAGASPFAPTGLGRGVSLSKDIIPKIPVVRDAATDIGGAVGPTIVKISKPINDLDYRMDKVYTETRNSIIPTDTMRMAETAKRDAIRMEVYNAPKARENREVVKQILEENPDFGYVYTGLSWKEHQQYTSAMRKPGFYEVRDRATNDVIEFGNRPVVDMDNGINIKPATSTELEGYGALGSVSKRNKGINTFNDASGTPRPVKPIDMSGTPTDSVMGELFSLGLYGPKTKRAMSVLMDQRAITRTRVITPHVPAKDYFSPSTRSKLFSTSDELDAFTSTRQLAVTRTYNNQATKTTFGLASVGISQAPKIVNPLVEAFASKNKTKTSVLTNVATAQDTNLMVTPKLDVDFMGDLGTKQTPVQDTITTPVPKPITIRIPTPTPAYMRPGGGIPIIPFSMGSGGSSGRRKNGKKTKALWQNDIELFNPFKNNSRKGVKKINSNRKIKSRKAKR